MHMHLDMLNDGIIIMLIGMLVVYFFLVVMIYAMKITSVIITKLNEIFPPEIKETEKPKRQQDDELLAVAIALAAVKRGI